MPPCHSGEEEILLIFAQMGRVFRDQAGADRREQNRPKQLRGGGCEGGAPLLKFIVYWDAAVCAVSAGGFLYV